MPPATYPTVSVIVSLVSSAELVTNVRIITTASPKKDAELATAAGLAQTRCSATPMGNVLAGIEGFVSLIVICSGNS